MKSIRIPAFFFLLVCMGGLYPFVHNYVLFGGAANILSTGATVVGFGALFLWQRSDFKITRSFLRLAAIHIVFLSLWSAIFNTLDYLVTIQSLLLGLMMIFLIKSLLGLDNFIRLFVKFFVIMVISMAIGLALLVLGKLTLLSSIDYASDLKIWNYGFFFVKRGSESLIAIRPAGWLDEPGSLAFIIMFLVLIIDKFYTDDKTMNIFKWILIVGGFLTTSLAHIATAFLYVVSKYARRPKQIIFTFAAMTILLGGAYFAMAESNDPLVKYLYNRTFQRVTDFVQTGEDAGRGEGFAMGPEIFNKNPFGISPQQIKMTYPRYQHENIWSPLLYYGVLGFPIFFSLVAVPILLYRKKNNLNWSLIIILGANLLQRPSYIYPMYLVLIYVLLYTQRISSEKEQV
ncbi:hypothetical protein [Roseivirga thermotolerans]|uniref:hypothetical protein n=1 Tax=Roseivirga thermotolerans TaxID=1758176 RepID=UPI00273D135E|nr:hypothetical protein [Roseivirga thermotolerans]